MQQKTTTVTEMKNIEAKKKISSPPFYGS